MKLFHYFLSVQDLTHHNHSFHNYLAVTLSVCGTMSYGACREQHSWRKMDVWGSRNSRHHIRCISFCCTLSLAWCYRNGRPARAHLDTISHPLLVLWEGLSTATGCNMFLVRHTFSPLQHVSDTSCCYRSSDGNLTKGTHWHTEESPHDLPF